MQLTFLLNLFNLFVSPVARFVAAKSSVIVKLQRVMAAKGPSVIVCSGDFNIFRQFPPMATTLNSSLYPHFISPDIIHLPLLFLRDAPKRKTQAMSMGARGACLFATRYSAKRPIPFSLLGLRQYDSLLSRRPRFGPLRAGRPGLAAVCPRVDGHCRLLPALS
jgi:hypothetical protein